MSKWLSERRQSWEARFDRLGALLEAPEQLVHDYDLHRGGRFHSVTLSSLMLEPEGRGTRVSYTEKIVSSTARTAPPAESMAPRCSLLRREGHYEEGSDEMTLELYSHPFSSYCQKVLIALYENDTSFRLKMLDQEAPENFAELARLWPLKKFPVLVDNGQAVIESSIIIEHLALDHPGPTELVPSDPKQALEIRLMDRFFDNYVMTAMQNPVSEALRTEGARKVQAMAEAHVALDMAYAWLEKKLDGRTWAVGECFTMADCAAAPSLFYADWVHQIGPDYPAVRAYRSRLLERPSFARVVDEARPYRSYFPLGAPDRD